MNDITINVKTRNLPTCESNDKSESAKTKK